MPPKKLSPLAKLILGQEPSAIGKRGTRTLTKKKTAPRKRKQPVTKSRAKTSPRRRSPTTKKRARAK